MKNINITSKNKIQNLFPKKHVIETSSGTASLIICLEILKKKSNTKKIEVLIPSVCCPSVLFAVNITGLKPVFIDMEFKRFNMSITDIKKKINKNTLAVICVHCFGIAANINLLKKNLNKKKISIIEDACLIFGGKSENGLYHGNKGDMAVFSFGYEKIIDLNSGGLIILKSVQDKILAKKILRNNKFFSKKIFKNSKFLSKFKKIKKNINTRFVNAKKFEEKLNGKNIIKPKITNEDVIWRYSIIIKKNREKLIEVAKKKGLIITSHYPALDKFQTNSKLKNSKLFDKNLINLFVKEGTTDEYIEKTCKLINRI